MNFRRSKAIFLKNWYLSLKFERIMDITFWPALDVLLWAFVALYLQEVGSGLNFYALFLGSVFLWMLFIRSSNDFAVYILEDFWKRTLHNLFASPLGDDDLFVGALSFTAFRILICTAFLLLFTIVALHFNIFAINWMLITLLYIPLIICGWALAFVLGGLFFRYGQDINVLAWALPWIFQPLSCVFYPLSSLPTWLQPISRIIPMTYVFEGFRAVINGQPATRFIAYAYAGSIIAFLLGLTYFILGIRQSKRTGRLARS